MPKLYNKIAINLIENFAINPTIFLERYNAGQIFVNESLVVWFQCVNVWDLGALRVEVIFTATHKMIKIYKTCCCF